MSPNQTRDELVVYVDDAEANQIVFEQSFAKRFRLKLAASGAEAIELLKTHTVAVLVTDQRMPGMSGLDLLAYAKVHYPDTIRVVITAYSDLDPILRAVNEGLVSRYIIKPWNRVDLDQTLAWAIEAFALGRDNSALQLRLMHSERLITLGSIAAAVLHDIHQPLGNLILNAERLMQLSSVTEPAAQWVAGRRQLTEAEKTTLLDLTRELPEIAQDLSASCNVIRELTGGLRQFLQSAPSSSQGTTEVVAIIRYALSVCREIATRARGRLLYEGPEQLPLVQATTTELTQILVNLIANAAQALLDRPPGGRVVVRAADEGELLRITVSDTGAGMSEEILQKLGTPFFSTRPDGTGLGMAQCRRLVGRLGGELTIESVVGRGTTVSFTVPKVAAAGAEPEPKTTTR